MKRDIESAWRDLFESTVPAPRSGVLQVLALAALTGLLAGLVVGLIFFSN